MLLFDHPFSSYCQFVRIALREKGIDFEVKLPEDLMRASPSGEFTSANPRAEVPALVDGDCTIFDSRVILEYLEDKHPEPSLFPSKDPAAKAHMRLIGEVCSTQYEAVNWAIGEIRVFKRATGEIARRIERNAEHVTRVLQDWLGERLGSKPYLSGNAFGYADICAAVLIKRSLMNGLGPRDGSPLLPWMERVLQRESVKRTFEEAVAAAEKMSAMSGIFDQGEGYKREYRDHRLDFLIRAGGVEIMREGLEKKNIRFSWPDVVE